MAELQSLLKQSAERYGALEDNFEREKREGKDELKGFGLRALSREETAAVRGVIGPQPTYSSGMYDVPDLKKEPE